MSCIPDIKTHTVAGLVDVDKSLTINELYGLGYALADNINLIIDGVPEIVHSDTKSMVNNTIMALTIPWFLMFLLLIAVLMYLQIFDLYLGIFLISVLVIVFVISLTYIHNTITSTVYDTPAKVRNKVESNVKTNGIVIGAAIANGYRGVRCGTEPPVVQVSSQFYDE